MGRFNADPRIMNANDPRSRMARHKAMKSRRLNEAQQHRDTAEWERMAPANLTEGQSTGRTQLGVAAPQVQTEHFDMSGGHHDGGPIGKFEKPKKKTRRAGKKKKKYADGGPAKGSKEWYKKHGIKPEVGDTGPAPKKVEGQYGDSTTKKEPSGTKIVVSIEPESPQAALTGESGKKRVRKALEDK